MVSASIRSCLPRHRDALLGTDGDRHSGLRGARGGVEVINSLLLRCDADCLYVDVGCNLGVFAGLAAAHGARAECYEVYPLYVAAAKRTAHRINRSATVTRFMDVKHRAVVDNEVPTSPMTLRDAPETGHRRE
jgi:hypothetical protein